MFKRRLVTLALALLLGTGAYLANAAVQTSLGEQALQATGLSFATLAASLDAAQQQQRPVLVDFSASWCPNCRAFHERVLGSEAVKQRLQSDYVLARVDYDSPEAAAFRKRYGVDGLPTVLLLAADGSLLRTIKPSLVPAEFLAQLQR